MSADMRKEALGGHQCRVTRSKWIKAMHRGLRTLCKDG